MEHGAVGCIHLIGTVHTAGADDTNGGLPGQHGACLHGAGVGTQHHVIINIEGILSIPGRVILRNVHQLEIVVVKLYFGSFHHFKAHAGEAVDHFIHHQRQGMFTAHGRHFGRLGHINGFTLQGFFLLLGLQHTKLFIQHFRKAFPCLVDHLSGSRPLFRGQLTHATKQCRQFTLLAQHTHPKVFQCLGAIHLAHFIVHQLMDFCDFFPHAHVPCSILSFRQ